MWRLARVLRAAGVGGLQVFVLHLLARSFSLVLDICRGDRCGFICGPVRRIWGGGTETLKSSNTG